MKRIFVFALWGLLISSSDASAQTQDDLFNGDVLHEIRIYIAPQDYATFKQTNFTCEDQDIEALQGQVISPLPRVICWFPIEFHWKFNGKDITLPQVAIESHGKGSRNNIKPSFKIDFSRYESRLTFLGLRYVILRANAQDPSQIHERVAMEFFRRLGIPAPRESHARLYINDQYAGAYTIVEYVDPVFIQKNLGESNGYLYAYEWTFPWVFNDLGTDSSQYSPLPFKPENNLTYFDPSPVPYMIQAINHTPDAQFSAGLAAYMDVNAWIREIAAEEFINEQDGILGDYGLDNFFLYRFENSVRYTVLPWDKSDAFWTPADRDIYHNFLTNVLTTRIIAAAPDLIALFQDDVRQAAAIAGGPGGWLEQEIAKEYAQIRQAVYDDPNKLCDPGATGVLRPCSNDQFDAEVAYMLQFAETRSAIVLGQLPEH
ncbi:MAG TPA: CotH kinase family protein [Terriglobia bacterium]|nr:CotH kinase family protein [Terriglobia bacterium]